MRVHDNGAFFSVSVSARELWDFSNRWPCSGMRGALRGMWFQFDKRNGDLVDIRGERAGYDGAAVLALSQDAQTYGQKEFTCANCGGPLPEGHGYHSRTRPVRRFCYACGNISEALAIGARRPAFLYDDGKGSAVSWTGGALGRIVHKQAPEHHRLRAVRYRVRMLDGSLWHGHGPTAHGNYIRLRPMKGE